MAFKRLKSRQEAPDDPVSLFRSLSRRQFPTEMPHQREIIKAYITRALNAKDVAIQLPTGSGKTLVGILIAEWRRRKYDERVVYLCPNKQLVNQTVTQCHQMYGLDVLGFTGQKSSYEPSSVAEYRTGRKIAITTYNSLFNVNPFFDDADVVIVDDAHAAENYIASMWSVEINGDDAAHNSLKLAIANLLRPHIGALDYSIICGDAKSLRDTGWVEKIPTPIYTRVSEKLIEILDEYTAENSLRYPWSLLRDHLAACGIYLGFNKILIRPLIPPTWTLPAFEGAKQRIYMSATLGEGGDLERLTGREAISRLAVPSEFGLESVGRRFFMFPEMSLDEAATGSLRLELMKIAGRTVVLTPSAKAARQTSAEIEDKIGFTVYSAEEIEESKLDFVQEAEAAAVLANRYDGIDFPKTECRLLCVDDLPKAANLQERFLQKRMGAELLLESRIQTRIQQAIGRCTRSLEDFSAVFVTGDELVKELTDKDKSRYLSPILQAEIKFGIDESIGVEDGQFIEMFNAFLENGDEWQDVERDILADAKKLEKFPFPASDELAKAVVHEIKYQKHFWRSDFRSAYEEARAVLSELRSPELRGYRALWHYLAGSAALLAVRDGDETLKSIVEDQYRNAVRAASNLSWTRTLLPPEDSSDRAPGSYADPDLLDQVERMESVLAGLGISHDRTYTKQERDIIEGLADDKKFEEAQRKLGAFLGFVCGNSEANAAPDPWWLSKSLGIVFEDHAGADETSVFGAVKARQADGHPRWLKENVEHASDVDIFSVIVSPVVSAESGAFPHLRAVGFWPLDDFRDWAAAALSTVRSLKASLPREGDLAWRSEAYRKLDEAGLSMKKIRAKCEGMMADKMLKAASK